jgi:opacity protein-like surface antigen
MGNEPMKAIAAAALAGIATASTPSLDADLFGTAAPPLSTPAENGPMAEVGSNWYLRGDVGLGLDPATSFSMAPYATPAQGAGVLPFDSSVGSADRRTDYSADIGVGYRFNNFLRGEATYEYRVGPSGGNANTVICPQSLKAVGTSGYYYGTLGNTENLCNSNLGLRQSNSSALASAYLDLGTYWGVTPYVGAGGGLNMNITSGSVAYTTGGTSYSADLVPTPTTPPTQQTWVNAGGTPLSPQPNVPFTNQVWDRSIHSTKYTMAWALMAGVGIRMSPSATLDIGYRYLNAGVINTPITTQAGSNVKQLNSSQEIRIGVRYMAD